MRELNENEKALITKNVKRLEEDKKYSEYSLEYTEFMLEKGLDLQFRTMRKQKEAEKKALMQDLAEFKMTLDICADQLENGVQEKEMVEETEVKETE